MSVQSSLLERTTTAVLLTACLLLPALSFAAANGRAARAQDYCELGIQDAFAGEVDRAESMFVAVLSTSPHDSRALADLGNVALMRGDPSLGLVFYDRAALSDSLDGGIRLDRALALALLGETAESQAEVRAGVRLAGSPAAAGALLGLRTEADSSATRGAPGAGLTREEVRNLLRTSLMSLPADSTRARSPGHPRPEPPRRSAGPRAEDLGEASVHLYWKR